MSWFFQNNLNLNKNKNTIQNSEKIIHTYSIDTQQQKGFK